MSSAEAEFPTLVGDPIARDAFVDQLTTGLSDGCPGSTATRRGSLQRGTADVYSDIDLAWVVPDDRFGAAVGSVITVLARVAPVLSLRSDPPFQRSERRRLLFARFAGVPLLWRLDLELWAASVAYDDNVDVDIAEGVEWCPHESALMNALGAIKALHRGRAELARTGLTRGLERVGADPLLEYTAKQRILALTTIVTTERPHLRDFAAQIAAATQTLP